VAVLGAIRGHGGHGRPGPDGYRDELLALRDKLGVTERLHFLEPQPYADMLGYASGADIGVITLPTRVLNLKLALPNRFFDLVMAGLPVASTPIRDVGCLIERFDLGQTFVEDDALAMATTICSMLDADRLCELRANVKAAARELCWEQVEPVLVKQVQRSARSSESLAVCIVARKNLSQNQRVRRYVGSLLAAGHSVTVVRTGASGARTALVDDSSRAAKELIQP